MSSDDGSGDWRRERGSCSALGGSGDDEEDDKVMDGEERRDCDQPDVEMVLLFPAYFSPAETLGRLLLVHVTLSSWKVHLSPIVNL
jgi:hypothetical protein